MKSLNIITMLVISGLMWGSAASADVFSTTLQPLVFDGNEFLKVSKCCKTSKTSVNFTISFPEAGKWELTHVNGIELLDADLVSDPVLGSYSKKNKKWYDLSFLNNDEEDQFKGLVEEIASENAGEEVMLSFKKFKLRLKNESDSEKVEFKLVGDFKLNRTNEKGKGVYKFKAEYENEDLHLESCSVEDDDDD